MAPENHFHAQRILMAPQFHPPIQPMAKAAVLSLCRSIELLKAIHFTFHRHSLNITKSVNHVILHSTLKAAAILEKCHLRAKAEKRSTRRHDEILAAFQIIDSCVKDGVKVLSS